MYPAKDVHSGLTPERVREVLHYDPQYGELWWLRIPQGGAFRIKRAGLNKESARRHRGYSTIKVDGVNVQAHRLAWLHYYGEWPKAAIDHIDGDRCNNRIWNLREATSAENNRNRSIGTYNSSGHKGVSWDKHLKAYRVTIIKNYRKHYVGCSRDLSVAVAMREEAEAEYFGEFAKVA